MSTEDTDTYEVLTEGQIVHLRDIASIIRQKPERLEMNNWVSDGPPEPDVSRPTVHPCGTTHCLGGWWRVVV